jgi:hypothetical protein
VVELLGTYCELDRAILKMRLLTKEFHDDRIIEEEEARVVSHNAASNSGRRDLAMALELGKKPKNIEMLGIAGPWTWHYSRNLTHTDQIIEEVRVPRRLHLTAVEVEIDGFWRSRKV